MIRLAIRTLGCAAAPAMAAIGLNLLGAGVALAADSYTMPFYDPTVTLSYGVDRDRRLDHQLDWTGQVWNDGDPHYGRVYDQHTGSDFPMALRSEVAAARDGTVVDTEGGFGTTQFGSFGNFVLLAHPDGHRTLYYHLASSADGGIAVAIGESVPAGEMVGKSGCSGTCFGPHLHFEFLIWNVTSRTWAFVDPIYERRWTTWPGRVPFLASYVRESNPGTEVVKRGQAITHWIEFRNDGGRTWRNIGVGRIALATWDPPAHDSAFVASDWPYPWMATSVDVTGIGPDGIGRFTFGLRGGPPAGSYVERFNLVMLSVHWFDYQRLGSFYIPITVNN